jgi:CHAT domain-containing protein
VESVASLWEESSDEPVSVYFGADATEDRFKGEAHGSRVIHLATHGYYIENVCGSERKHAIFGANLGWVGENPLLHSGLFLAGANLHGEGADSADVEDGILTAYEVSAMNLKGTRLVVLSACETALGAIETGEGVYGLRRAFQMAGARTVVSALWPVSDEVTSEMLSGLYERNGENLPMLIREMELARIRKLRAEGRSDHPASWAAFIALGDWR